MSSPQPVLAPPAKAAVFLVATVNPGGEAAVRDALDGLAGLVRSVSFRAPEDGLTGIVGIGATVWPRLFDAPPPAGLHPFRELRGPRHHAPSTPGDLLLHVRAVRMDLCFELTRLVAASLGDAVTVVDEVHGFRYFDERDLLGFVDGSENPQGRAAAEAVHVGDEDPGYEGGAYVTVQKYVHDLTAWDALPVEEQERIIGRTKSANVELADDVKPADSHVAVNTIVDADGTERQILRDNMPFGSIGSGEFGTYFIGYSRTPEVTERMLDRMFLGEPPGATDRILDFSTAVTGCLFFVPSADFLDVLPDPPHLAAATAGPPAVPAGSLGIGSLKGA
ncbi:Dyp-type peroxidase [Streptomyces sp. SKN60]|uniref:Dyp-type peroxidase n=1 Tax=Streptomyces sp. SKN60 TaxID=2855506 RepID=UPI002248563C|nr:Dyp-type peroxidase [Streptomyces sp. SKN60]MCX2180258.1 Dyp-type peroxidase [Streptomyces sp. SKN60]